MSWQGAYQSGRPYGICDRCGWKFRLDELRLEWTELKVCAKCWDPRPVHLSAPSISTTEGAAIPGARPEVLEEVTDAELMFQFRDGSYFDPDVDAQVPAELSQLLDEDGAPLMDEDGRILYSDEETN